MSDMPKEEFRKAGYQLIDWIADYLNSIEKYPVMSQIKPGDISKQIPVAPPVNGEKIEKVLSDIDKVLIDGITHWNHPGFMAYFNTTSSGPGILAEILTAAFSSNGMLWKTSPVVTEMEKSMMNWFRQMVGLPENYWGIIYDTASTSSMHAIASAREQMGLGFREKGAAGRKDLPKIILYSSEQAHSSIDKGALLLGVGLDGIRKIPVNEKFEMIPEKLEEAIDEDIKKGCKPFCVVATVGTTSTTSVDPVEQIANIAEKYNLWLHVDAAYAGVTAMIPEMKWVSKNWERADSIVINPHKWMFTPLDLSILFTRKKEILKRAFSLVPEYLKTAQDSEVDNLMDYGFQLGRRFRSLKLWFIIRYFGVEGIANRLREHIAWAKEFSNRIIEANDFELTAPVPFSTVCFRYNPGGKAEAELNTINEKLLEKINSTGKIFLSHTKLYEKFVIRLTIGGIRHEQRHIENAWELVKTTARELK
ncbi:MAG: aminotransferase class I/II-fold pyridoxal phosphate-dependent enzyme [Ignavibacteriota bacterium]|nr:aminotransferase class I/II-fold pyridoxal phosphate-dependent enzyme [Ignavibacteriota bacterium]MCO6446577.1 aminotransferase class I/II-fold pyridoxal phosphate-dependent enzyme [Ignavibacterium album]MCZ2269200.1 aminotransferase class I/II-fold pyridoxal phosphate-dependent enzyme [Ignavibacteriales bacterium]QKJ99886.1 MAG: aminotransferase class I/II-fold pyridoxal phosphate-dependent enzyme [Ignavibacteriota bacterium]HOJ06536.1 aminotransferase class I/II-fold pyridoxal phosphate-de